MQEKQVSEKQVFLGRGLCREGLYREVALYCVWGLLQEPHQQEVKHEVCCRVMNVGQDTLSIVVSCISYVLV